MKVKSLSERQSQEVPASQQQHQEHHRPHGIKRNMMRFLLRLNSPLFSVCFALFLFIVPILLWHRTIFISDNDDEDTTMYRANKMGQRIPKNKLANSFALLYGSSDDVNSNIDNNSNIHNYYYYYYYYENNNTNNNNNNTHGVVVDDILDGPGEVLEKSGHRIETNICFVENETHLSFRDLKTEEKYEKLTESVFLVRGGCDMSTLTRDIAQFFDWQQEEEEQQQQMLFHKQNNHTLPLFVRTVHGDEMYLPRLTKLIVDVGNRDCDEKKQTVYDQHHILHWIRVATGLFELQPWWDESDIMYTNTTVNGNNDNSDISNVNTAVRYVVVNLKGNAKRSKTTTTTTEAAVGIENDEKNLFPSSSLLLSSSSYLLQPLSSLNELGCVNYILLAARRSSRWFHSEQVAHRFRLRWMYYMHYNDLQRKQQKEENEKEEEKEREKEEKQYKRDDSITTMADTVVAMWGKGPHSPILRRVIIASVTDEVMNGTSASPYYYHHHYMNTHKTSTNNNSHHMNIPSENSVAMAVADKLIEASRLEALSPLTITVLASPVGGELFEEDEMMSYLYEKFGEVSRVQLIYLPGSNNSYDMIKNKGTEKKYNLVFVQDYLELLRLLVLTDVLISPHSVALASAVVMQPGSVVIELFPSDCRSEMYLGLATAMHMSYASYEGVSNKGRRRDSSICSILYDNKASIVALPFPGITTSSSSSSFSNDDTPIFVRHSRLSLCDRKYGVITITQVRLYHLVKNALSSLWLRNSRFFGVMAFDRR